MARCFAVVCAAAAFIPSPPALRGLGLGGWVLRNARSRPLTPALSPEAGERGKSGLLFLTVGGEYPNGMPLFPGTNDMNTHATRRELLRLAAAGALTTANVPWFRAMAADAAVKQTKPKSCILLWMDGGPSQAHTFDAKPRGEYPTISTAVPGTQLTDCLPKMATVMNDVTLLRGMTTGEGDHYRAKYLLHTGYPRLGGFDYPALGCIAASEVGPAINDMPNFVTIDAGFDKNNGGRFYRSVPSYLGVKHSPLAVADPDKGLENLAATGDDAEFAQQLELLMKAEKRIGGDFGAPAVLAKQDAFQRALTLMKSKKASAFDLKNEPEKLKAAYGSHKFGKSCLMARRLVEAGTTFVEVFHRGWDDHEGAGKRIRTRCEWMDPAIATLISDLKDRGLLDSTLIVWMGEFGRSPVNGSGHYARAWTTFLAGGGLKNGQIVGKTDDKEKNPGSTVVDRPTTVPDFFATICQIMGIDAKKEVLAPGDRPMRLVEKTGKPIEGLI